MRQDNDRSRIPSWNGHPDGWKNYKEEVRIWMLGSKLDVQYCLAARLVENLSGPARQIGLRMAEAELEAKKGG